VQCISFPTSEGRPVSVLNQENLTPVLAEDQGFQISLDTEPQGEGPDKVVVLALKGEVDLATAPDVREMLIRLVSSGIVRIVVDLSDVTFIDSSGLGVLAAAAKRLDAANGWLRVRKPAPQARQILELTALDQVLELE
jgi:anti-sigma B factor antagonist